MPADLIEDLSWWTQGNCYRRDDTGERADGAMSRRWMRQGGAALLGLVLAACGPAPPTGSTTPDAGDAQAAEELGRQFDAQYAAGHWDLAKANGDVLTARYPASAAARRIAAHYRQAREKGDAARQTARLAGLWSYLSQPAGKGRQASATIYARDPIQTGAGRSRVRLIFRDHPAWGRSSYLVLESGDFDCYGGCQLKVTVDGKPRRMAGSRPKTDEAIAMFIEDERTLWRLMKSSKEISIEVPLKAGGTQAAVFEVGGLDPSRMKGW